MSDPEWHRPLVVTVLSRPIPTTPETATVICPELTVMALSQPSPMVMAFSVPAPGLVNVPIATPIKVPAAGPEAVGAMMLRAVEVPPVVIATDGGKTTRKPSAEAVPVVWVIGGTVAMRPRQRTVPAAVLCVKPEPLETSTPLMSSEPEPLKVPPRVMSLMLVEVAPLNPVTFVARSSVRPVRLPA